MNKLLLLRLILATIALCTLLSCSVNSALRPIDSDNQINLEVQDGPTIPIITAQLSARDNFLVIAGEVHKRGDIPLNGYLTITATDAQGKWLWSDNAELKRVGLRLFGYRIFEKQGPEIPPAGSKITIEFHKA